MPEMTWWETVEVSWLLHVAVIDLIKVPVRLIEQALVIIRARHQ